jgi:hypothetical protein
MEMKKILKNKKVVEAIVKECGESNLDLAYPCCTTSP